MRLFLVWGMFTSLGLYLMKTDTVFLFLPSTFTYNGEAIWRVKSMGVSMIMKEQTGETVSWGQLNWEVASLNHLDTDQEWWELVFLTLKLIGFLFHSEKKTRKWVAAVERSKEKGKELIFLLSHEG